MNQLIVKAERFARSAHQGQIRKIRGTPYIEHPLNVAEILRSAHFAEEVVAAGLLHDVVEDTSVTIQEIQLEFGPEVARLVAGNTEEKNLTWEERKMHTIQSVRVAGIELKALVAADKLDNLKSIISNYDEYGDAVWSHFKRGRDKQYWYYSNVSRAILDHTSHEEVPGYFYELRELAECIKPS
ncbi:HD domain-containing protein [Peribacillus sp. SCS-37]|uniref:HD domain-containing protein n=1 Tax=Paraperibacillus esterisolvens TaxID=3115296 RepID=UPI0039058CA2